MAMTFSPSADDAKSLAAFGLCLNARASIVQKQMGADPNMPGPGQCVPPRHRALAHFRSHRSSSPSPSRL